MALEPGQPAILQNLAVSVGMHGRCREARALFYQIHRDHPDYLFARTSVAVHEAQEGNLERAYQLVWPLFQRKRFHLSEFATLCGTMVEILVLEGRRKNARHWIDLLGRVVPGHASIPHLKAIAGLEG
jgi:hypothetical protein